MVLLNRSLRVPQAKPRLGALFVAIRPQEIQLFACEFRHRYRFHSVRWRQAASGKKQKNRIINIAQFVKRFEIEREDESELGTRVFIDACNGL